jgi:N-acetylglutamate synthase-like GNAT family acetyltransferase
MTSLIFRKAEQNDLQDIIHLLADDELGKQREKPSEGIPPSYQRAFERIKADPNQFLMVLEKNGAIVGTCHLTLMPSLTFQGSLRMNIEAVRIAASCRGQGLGEKMILQAIELARKEDCQMIQLTANKQRLEAKRFYEKLGFKATHEGMKIYLP